MRSIRMSADTGRRPVAPDTLEAQIVIEQRGQCAKTLALSRRTGFLNHLPICGECSRGLESDPGETLAVAI
jgi:hypothetical protein